MCLVCSDWRPAFRSCRQSDWSGVKECLLCSDQQPTFESCRQYVSGKEDVSLWLLNWVTIMLNNVIISVIQLKSIATIREKRKRYRKKKKDKFHANHIPISEEGSAQCHLDSGIECHEGTPSKSSSCRSSSSLSDFRWREVNEKAAMIRQEQAEKEEELK